MNSLSRELRTSTEKNCFAYQECITEKLSENGIANGFALAVSLQSIKLHWVRKIFDCCHRNQSLTENHNRRFSAKGLFAIIVEMKRRKLVGGDGIASSAICKIFVIPPACESLHWHIATGKNCQRRLLQTIARQHSLVIWPSSSETITTLFFGHCFLSIANNDIHRSNHFVANWTSLR